MPQISQDMGGTKEDVLEYLDSGKIDFQEFSQLIKVILL